MRPIERQRFFTLCLPETVREEEEEENDRNWSANIGSHYDPQLVLASPRRRICYSSMVRANRSSYGL